MTAPAPRLRWPDALPYLAFVAYAVLTFLLIPRHELWRDEAADWLYALWGPSLRAVLHDLGWQMDPGGWHTALYLVSRLFYSPLAMQVFHSLMAIAGVFLFIHFSPFSRLEKILYPFGFFVFYEYNIIARNYVPILMFLCGAAVLYPRRFDRPWLYMLLLAGMAQTHLYGGLFAGTLALLYAAELAAAHRFQWRAYGRYAPPLLALGAVFLVSLYQMIPFAEVRDMLSGGGEIDYFQTARGILLRMIAPVVRPNFYFWPANTVSDQHSTLLALVYLAGILYLVHARPVSLAYFLVTGGAISYLLVFRGSNTRFIGMLWLLLIFTQWIAHHYPPPARWADTTWMRAYPRARQAVFSAFLSLQALGAPTAFWMDYHHPFSGGRETAQFLNAHLRTTNALMGTVLSYATQSIQPYLRPDLPALYGLEQERFYRGLICDAKWYENDKKVPPVEALQRLFRKHEAGNHDQVLLITLMPLQAPGIRILGRFPPDGRVLCGDESFFVHEIDVPILRAQIAAPRR